MDTFSLKDFNEWMFGSFLGPSKLLHICPSPALLVAALGPLAVIAVQGQYWDGVETPLLLRFLGPVWPGPLCEAEFFEKAGSVLTCSLSSFMDGGMNLRAE